MGRYARSGRNDFDMCREEADDFVLPQIARSASIRKPERKAKATLKPKLLLSQDHLTGKGYFVNSHLLLLPRGEEMPLVLRRIFCHHPFKAELVRSSWNPISDEELNDMYRDYDIFWLCESDWLPAEMVKTIVQASMGEMGRPQRVITDEIVLG